MSNRLWHLSMASGQGNFGPPGRLGRVPLQYHWRSYWTKIDKVLFYTTYYLKMLQVGALQKALANVLLKVRFKIVFLLLCDMTQWYGNRLPAHGSVMLVGGSVLWHQNLAKNSHKCFCKPTPIHLIDARTQKIPLCIVLHIQ